jgi:hypothetical protein
MGMEVDENDVSPAQGHIHYANYPYPAMHLCPPQTLKDAKNHMLPLRISNAQTVHTASSSCGKIIRNIGFSYA